MISCSSRNQNSKSHFKEKVDRSYENKNEKTIKSLFSQDDNVIQKFDIQSDRKSIIKGRKGTIIEISENSFDIKRSLIKVDLIECYLLDEILFNNLLTVTKNGELLQSQGMIYLKFKDENGKVLKPIKSKLKIKFPVELNPKTKLFSGQNYKGFIKWTLTKEDEVEKSIEVQRRKGKLVKMPTFVSCVEKSNGVKICDTTYHLIDTTSSTYKNWAIVKTLSDGWLNLDHFIDEKSSVSLKINNLTKNTIAIVVFKDNPVIYSAKITPNLKNLSIVNCDAEILFIEIKSDSMVKYNISDFRKNITRNLNIQFETVSIYEFKTLIKNKFGNRKVEGYSLAKY